MGERIFLSGRNYSRVDEQVFGTVSTNDTLSCTLPRWTSSNFFHGFSILRTSFTFQRQNQSPTFEFLRQSIFLLGNNYTPLVSPLEYFPTDTLSRPIFHGSCIFVQTRSYIPISEISRGGGRAFDFFHRYRFNFTLVPKATLSLSLLISPSLEVISSATSQFAIPNFASFTVLLLFSRHVNLGFEWERGHEGLLVEGKKKGSFSWIFLSFFL